MSDINLTASMRSNLLSLQNTQDLMDTTSERLSTGQKVNSAIDNPSSYYTASSLDNRASDLSALLDSMGQGLSVLSAADEAIESITNFVEQADAILTSASELGDTAIKFGGEYDITAMKKDDIFKINVTDSNGTKKTISVTITDDMLIAATGEAEFNTALATALNKTDGTGFGKAAASPDPAYTPFVVTNGVITFTDNADANEYVFEMAEDSVSVGYNLASATTLSNAEKTEYFNRFSSIMGQITSMAGDASYNGINLLDGSGSELSVYFNEDRTSSLNVKGVDITSFGLGLDEINVDDFATVADLSNAMSTVDAAIADLRSYASDFGNNYSTLENREEFTENLINVLTEGSDKLILADMNEESANMLALQTSQALATNSLALASQSAQTVLQLF